MKTKRNILVILAIVTGICVHGQSVSKSYDYPIQPVPFTSVNLDDSFWLTRINTIDEVTIPHLLEKCQDRIMSFKIAAGIESGIYQTSLPFDDTDVYKTIEAISYSLYYNPDDSLEKVVDSIITIIGMAQEPDGYLYAARTIGAYPAGFPEYWLGANRWDNVHDLSHELYNMGHLIEAGCAYFEATGKDNLLQIGIKAADLIDETFGWGKLENYPGHQIIEMALTRLYKLTNEIKYLNLARFFLDVRGPDGAEYSQSHQKVADQTEAVGHSVRSMYMYSGMADVAAYMDEYSYINALDQIWEDMVSGKMYITGGIGSSAHNEGFTESFDLPNRTSYCENCSSIGNIYFNHRLFLLHGESKYIDVLERILYNGLLSGISLSGDRFFYYNRLEAEASTNRSSWFGCACCPPNLAKYIPSVPGYIYATRADTLYINLFMSDSANIELAGSNFGIAQETDYPWDGKVSIKTYPSNTGEYTLMVRIPGWTQNEVLPGNLYSFINESGSAATITLNGEDLIYDIHKGYAQIKRNWSSGDELILNLPVESRKIIAREEIAADRAKFAVQRGPLVFCAEGVDNDNNILLSRYDQSSETSSVFDQFLLNGVQTIRLPWIQIDGSKGDTTTLIPYSYWNNRGGSPMQVWLSDYSEISYPDSLIFILKDDSASTNYVSPWESLHSIYNLSEPSSSSDYESGAFGNWQAGGSIGKWNFVQYNFAEDKPISSSEVYWWRDGAGVNIPEMYYLSYWDYNSDTFKMIKSTLKVGSDIVADQYNRDLFETVLTNKIRLNFYSDSYAQGILEWKVYSPGNSVGISLEKEIEKTMRLWPNPALGEVNIEIISPHLADIRVFNISGKLVMEGQFREHISFDSSKLGGRGIYFINIQLPDQLFTQKLIVN